MNQISYLTEEKFEHKRKAQILLEELKRKEQKIKFHERKIGKNTIVYCKNEERLDEYEDSYNNIKKW
jgi:hypothetical protein